MEVSGELHASATLLWGKFPRNPFTRGLVSLRAGLDCRELKRIYRCYRSSSRSLFRLSYRGSKIRITVHYISSRSRCSTSIRTNSTHKGYFERKYPQGYGMVTVSPTRTYVYHKESNRLIYISPLPLNELLARFKLRVLVTGSTSPPFLSAITDVITSGKVREKSRSQRTI
jgi:hypothetical protein